MGYQTVAGIVTAQTKDQSTTRVTIQHQMHWSSKEMYLPLLWTLQQTRPAWTWYQ